MEHLSCIVHYDIKDGKYTKIKTISDINREKICAAKTLREELGGANSHIEQCQSVPDEIDLGKHSIHLDPCYKKFVRILSDKQGTKSQPGGSNDLPCDQIFEIYKTKVNLNPEFMKDIFVTNDVPYSLRSGNGLLQPSARTTNFGIETTPFIGHKLWQTLPNEIKAASSLAVFKNRIKSWKGERCNCRLCRIFIPNLGFLI